MTWFDALCHGLTTAATGGFSTHDASLGYFESRAVEIIAMVFMIIGGVNFTLHFLAWQTRSLRNYARDPEFRAYFAIMGASVVVHNALSADGGQLPESGRGAARLRLSRGLDHHHQRFHHDAFRPLARHAAGAVRVHACSSAAAAARLPAASKVMRWLLLYRQGAREITRLVHPAAEIPVRLGNNIVPQRVVDAVWGLFAIYVVIFGVMMLILLATGVDQVTAFAAVAASLNNVGPGIGGVAANFVSLAAVDKWVCIVAMLLGRLEIFTLVRAHLAGILAALSFP